MQRETRQAAVQTAFMLLLATAIPAAIPTPVSAQAQPLPPGNPVRKAVMNALRPAVQRDLKQKVIFKVNVMRVQNGWAFLDGEPLQPNGRRIDFSKTKYRADVREGTFGGGIFALLRKRGSAWRVVTYRLGPTDVTWATWDKEYHAPRSLFPKL